MSFAHATGGRQGFRLDKFIDFFDSFAQFIQNRNMYYLDPNILKPLTKPVQLAFVDLVGASLAKWFVSHFWGTALKYTRDALCKHADSVSTKIQETWLDQSYWICTFSNNQYRTLLFLSILLVVN